MPLRQLLLASRFVRPPSAPLILLAISVLSYGVLIPWLGFYWDDWPKAWFLHLFGPQGFEEVFSLDRPFLSWTYFLTTTLLGERPLTWQFFALLTHWLSAVALWQLIRSVWPHRQNLATYTAAFFLVFPGFSQHSISLIYSHYFLILTIHFSSLGLMVRSTGSNQRRRLLLLGLSILGASYSLFSIEYFVGLELTRPFLLLLILAQRPGARDSLVQRFIRAWSPFVPVLVGYLTWRVLVLGFPTYQPTLLTSFTQSPTETLAALFRTIGEDLVDVTLGSWGSVFSLPNQTDFGKRSSVGYYSIVVFTWSLFFIGELRNLKSWSAERVGAPNQGRPLEFLAAGLLAFLLSGVPMWLTGLPIELGFPSDRFGLPMAVGASLILVAMTSPLTTIERTGLVKLAFVSLIVGLAAGKQFQYGTNYRRERDLQSQFYWQLVWRVPALQAGTTILTHELPFSYDDDESLTAGINWIYAPDQNSRNMPYLLYFLKLRLGSGLPGLERGLRIEEKTRATYFLGSTSKVIVMAFDYPKCLRILDPVLDDGLTGLPFLVAEAVPLSDLDLVLISSDRAVTPPTEFFGPEPAHGWCYYFESADLARQSEDWAKVAELGDMALALEARPNDASERIPFIEGYAHMGRWREATNLSLRIVEEQPPMVRLVCRTWNRIERSTSPDTEQQLAVRVLRTELKCTEIEQS